MDRAEYTAPQIEDIGPVKDATGLFGSLFGLFDEILGDDSSVGSA